MSVSSVQAVPRSLGLCLLLLALAPWVASAYAPVDTEALFPRQPGWHAGRQGWFGGLATHLTLFDEATAWLPTGEASLELDPGAPGDRHGRVRTWARCASGRRLPGTGRR